MKKTIFKLLGTGLIAVSVFGFESCGDSTEYDAKTDTIYSLDAPRVTAKAYPGVNYISWEPVTSAQGYKIYRVQDGGYSVLRNVASDVTCYADIASSDHILADGKEYKYIVEAVSDTDPASREVYVKNSKGTASVKAVVPTAGSPAISAEPVSDSAKDYIKKYYEKLVTKASENVKLSVNQEYYYAEYPATAGFKYGIACVPKGKYEALGDSVAANVYTENYKEDYKAEFSTPVVSSSEVEILLTVTSVSDLYKPVVVKLGSLTAKDIGESMPVTNVDARYIASKSVVVSWAPAKLMATGKNSPVENFKVYRSSDADSTWTALDAEVKEGQKADDVTGGATVVSEGYYITDTVEDDSIGYTYYVVHTDGTYFGSYDVYNNSKRLAAVTVQETDSPTLYVSTFVGSTDGVENTIKITSEKANENQTLTLSYVKLAENADGDAVEYIPSEFTVLELANNDGYADSYINYIEKAKAGTYLVKLTASEKDKKDASVYEVIIVSPAEALGYTLDVTSDGTKVTVTEYIAKDSKVDSVSNYRYTLYKVVTTTSKDYFDSVSVTTANLGNVELAYPAGETEFCKKDIEDKRSTESNVSTLYYVVKALVSDSSVFAKVSE